MDLDGIVAVFGMTNMTGQMISVADRRADVSEIRAETTDVREKIMIMQYQTMVERQFQQLGYTEKIAWGIVHYDGIIIMGALAINEDGTINWESTYALKSVMDSVNIDQSMGIMVLEPEAFSTMIIGTGLDQMMGFDDSGYIN